jgi:hypothetical protein
VTWLKVLGRATGMYFVQVVNLIPDTRHKKAGFVRGGGAGLLSKFFYGMFFQKTA